MPALRPVLPVAAPTHRVLRILVWLNLVVEVLIVCTGGLVRLSGSGLGCPTWPQCVPGSYVPVAHQEQSWHKYIEFGNRTLTGLVGIVAIALLVAVWWWARDRKGLLLPVGLVFLGILVQAVVGGISVHLELNPWIVALHFLTSMLLVCASAWLVWREREGDGPRVWLVRKEIRWLATASALMTIVVLVLGTLVTGAGPHSGDAEQPARLAVDARTMSWIHADAVMLLCGLVVAVLIAVRLTAAASQPWRNWLWVLIVILVQGVIGYTQYFLGVPAALVLLHMLGASLLVVFVTWAMLSLRERASSPSAA